MLLLTLLVRLVALAAVAVLLIIAARRSLFTLTLLRPQPPLPAAAVLPTVLLLVPVRDEAATLPPLFPALDRLDYPRDRVQVVFIDDGSTDGSGSLLAAAADKVANWQLLTLPKNVGKAQALNEAVAAFGFGEIVYIFDADHRPRSDCLRTAVVVFADPQVAAVSGRMLLGNPYASPAAFYAKVESLVHQLITMRGKDMLGLGPALLGSNNGVRRSALEAVGGFRPGAFLEDSDLTLALHRAGYTTRYVPQAISVHQAPVTVRGYVRQHLRWGRGFNDVASSQLGALLRDRRLSRLMRVELALFALGYLDRLALLAALGLLAIDTLLGSGLQPVLIFGVALSVGLPLVQIVAAFAYDRAPRAMWLRLPWVPLFFLLDAAVAVGATLATALARQRTWTQTERA